MIREEREGGVLLLVELVGLVKTSFFHIYLHPFNDYRDAMHTYTRHEETFCFLAPFPRKVGFSHALSRDWMEVWISIFLPRSLKGAGRVS